MRLATCISISFFLSSAAIAKTPTAELTQIITEKLDAVSTAEKFNHFIQNNPQHFPKLNKENPISMVVVPEEVTVLDDSYTLFVGYRQVFIEKTKGDKNAQFLMDLWTTPEFFQKLYDLDGPSIVESENTKTQFKGRVFKKVPGLENQDYILNYSVTSFGKNYSQIRAKLDKDTTGFALRDNLKMLEVTKEGLIVREIHYIYPLRWYVRALGGTARGTMKDEVNKTSIMEKCLTEGAEIYPPNDELIKECKQKL